MKICRRRKWERRYNNWTTFFSEKGHDKKKAEDFHFSFWQVYQYFLSFKIFCFFSSHYLSFSQNNNLHRFLTRSFFRGLYQFFGSINITITIIILISTPMFISISITILMLIYLFMNVVATVRLWIVISYRAEHLER